MPYVRDAFDDVDDYDRGQERKLKKLPECCMCGYKITDEDLYVINDEFYCMDCISECKESTDKYVED